MELLQQKILAHSASHWCKSPCGPTVVLLSKRLLFGAGS